VAGSGKESAGCCDSPWPAASGGNRENPRLFPPSVRINRSRSLRSLHREMRGEVHGWSRPHNGSMPIRQEDVSITAQHCWQNFLHRPPLLLDREDVRPWLAGKRVLITGAGGWIGSALTRAVSEFEPEHLVLIEAAERNLYELELALRHLPASIHQTHVLGSVSDLVLLEEVFQRFGPQLVYHAAAFKHVPVMEQNPFAAIENNAIATDLLTRLSLDYAAEQLIMVSTDKAVDPLSIMGASKRIAELVLLARLGAETHLKAIRLGNVFGSEGSIVPLFRKQIASGGPVTITHPDVRRYFVTSEDVVTLLLSAASIVDAQGILAPDLGEPIPVRAVAEHLIAQYATAVRPAVVFTQLRPGDKLAEVLLSGRESYAASAESRLRPIVSPAIPAKTLNEILAQLRQACRERSLDKLLTAVKRAVPEYQPSSVIEAMLKANTGHRA
jgi:FlaA1/EpsC-like NDP-sugar epimerase